MSSYNVIVCISFICTAVAFSYEACFSTFRNVVCRVEAYKCTAFNYDSAACLVILVKCPNAIACDKCTAVDCYCTVILCVNEVVLVINVSCAVVAAN